MLKGSILKMLSTKIIKVIFVKIWKADKAILKMVEGRERGASEKMIKGSILSLGPD